ncbi:MAG: 1-deoxy-D-xylulose-5-phosphate synthase [Acidimicrobiia bacterium]
MLLETIESPVDLKALTPEQLVELAAEIRAVIIDSVNEHGGHLGSNLGVVELTLALHRVFDSPEDIILWDTGHQTYPHKLVTGRAEGFARLRQADGLSGYPSRAESDHDWIENSHASTVLSWAYGLAVAESTKGEDARRIVAVIGDGSLTGGMAFEGLNNLGHSGRDCIIILNDNGRSYAPTVSLLGGTLVKIRNNPVYMRRQARMEKLLADLPLVGNLARSGMDATKAAIREMLAPTAFFETLGVRYAGPFDGHDIAALEEALRNAAAMPGGPQVIHVLTQKGRGYGPAENDPIKRLHDTSESKPGSFTAAFTEALVKEGEARPELFAITAAMPDSTGLLAFSERFPGRMIDVGIAEQHAVTAAAGMAMGGLRPVVAVYSTFLTRAIDQVNLDVGLHGQPVVFCLDRAGITGDDGPSHHGVLDMVLLTKVPNMTVLAPSSYQEIGQMLHDALEITDGPVAIRWAKTAARQAAPDEVGSGLRARRVREGTDLCILSVGKMLDAAEAAADALAAEGLSVSVWDVRCCKPLDPEMIAAAADHRWVLTVEDGLRDGGVGMAMADLLTAPSIETPPTVRVLGVPDRYVPHGKPDAILAALGLDASGITAAALAMTRAGDATPVPI